MKHYRRVLLAGLCLLGLSYFGNLCAQTLGSQQAEVKLTAFDQRPFDIFGAALSVYDDRVLVGARWADQPKAENMGAAYLYLRQLDGTWRHEAKFNPVDGASYDEYGSAVALDRDTAVVGAFAHDGKAPNAGAVYIYQKLSNGDWVMQQKLEPEQARESMAFGRAVALSGDSLLIGAPGAENSNAGSVYAYRRNGSQWQLEAKILASDGAPFDEFGHAIALDGDRAIIGMVGGRRGGVAYIFNRQGGKWQEVTKLRSQDDKSRFGYSVALKGDWAIVGAFADDEKAADAGAAYLYYFDGKAWLDYGKLMASDASLDDKFGYAVAINDGVAAVGAIDSNSQLKDAGATYIFSLINHNWQEVLKLSASDGKAEDQFGNPIGLNSGRLAVAALRSDDKGDNSGAVYVYPVMSLAAHVPIASNAIGNTSSTSVASTAVSKTTSSTQVSQSSQTSSQSSFGVGLVNQPGTIEARTVQQIANATANRAPTLVSPGAQRSREGDSVRLQIAALDPDGDNMLYTVSGLPQGLMLNAANGMVSGTIARGTLGQHKVDVRVQDGQTESKLFFYWTVEAGSGSASSAAAPSSTSASTLVSAPLNGQNSNNPNNVASTTTSTSANSSTSVSTGAAPSAATGSSTSSSTNTANNNTAASTNIVVNPVITTKPIMQPSTTLGVGAGYAPSTPQLQPSLPNNPAVVTAPIVQATPQATPQASGQLSVQPNTPSAAITVTPSPSISSAVSPTPTPAVTPSITPVVSPATISTTPLATGSFDINRAYRYVRFVAESELNHLGTASIAELYLFGPNEESISRDNWRIVSASSEERVSEDGRASYLFDNDEETIWHTAWQGIYPHEVTLDLGASYKLGSFKLLPRQDGYDVSLIKEFSLYLSEDGRNWVSAIVRGQLDSSTNLEHIRLPGSSSSTSPNLGQSYRYVKLVAESSLDGGDTTSMAEFYLLDANLRRMPRNTWQVNVDSYEVYSEQGHAVYAIDGDIETIWHSSWSQNLPKHPHEFVIDLGIPQVIGGFVYLPRQDGYTAGMIKGYKLYVSPDGRNWSAPVASGFFDESYVEKQVILR
ncbi:MAG: discoidin domain-containing protein [Deinococcales bacterium]